MDKKKIIFSLISAQLSLNFLMSGISAKADSDINEDNKEIINNRNKQSVYIEFKDKKKYVERIKNNIKEKLDLDMVSKETAFNKNKEENTNLENEEIYCNKAHGNDAESWSTDGFYINNKCEINDLIFELRDDNAVSICGCNNSTLTHVNIPDTIKVGKKYYSVKSIGYSAFNNCLLLREVQLPNSSIIIESYAFYNCQNLKSVIVPPTVEEIKIAAFLTFSDQITFYVKGDMSEKKLNKSGINSIYIKINK